MGEQKETAVLLKVVLDDKELGQRMDTWFDRQGLKTYQCDDKFVLRDLNGNLEDTFNQDDLIAEYRFQVANSKIPKKCREE